MDSRSVRWFAVLDFEATCWPRDGHAPQLAQEIVEFPTMLYRVVGGEGAAAAGAGAGAAAAGPGRLELVTEWRAYVRPTTHPELSAFCTELTGIAQATVDAARPLADVLAAHGAWLAAATQGAPPEQVLFVTCGDWDLKTMLPLELRNKRLAAPSAAYSRWANLKREFASAFRVRGREPDMKAMLQLAGLRLEGQHHSGLDDARNIGRCLEALWARGRTRLQVRTSG